MKKKLAIIVCLITPMIFSACGDNDKYNQSTYIEDEYLDMDEIDELEKVDNNLVTEPSKKILKADLYDNIVQIGNNVIEMPCTYDELIDAGITLTGEITEGALIEAGKSETVECTIKDTKATISFKTLNDERISLKDAIAYNINSKGDDIIFPGGIKCGNSLDDLEKIAGKATNEDNNYSNMILSYINFPYIKPTTGSYYLSDANSSYISATNEEISFVVDRNNGTITSISKEYIAENTDSEYE